VRESTTLDTSRSPDAPGTSSGSSEASAIACRTGAVSESSIWGLCHQATPREASRAALLVPVRGGVGDRNENPAAAGLSKHAPKSTTYGSTTGGSLYSMRTTAWSSRGEYSTATTLTNREGAESSEMTAASGVGCPLTKWSLQRPNQGVRRTTPRDRHRLVRRVQHERTRESPTMLRRQSLPVAPSSATTDRGRAAARGGCEASCPPLLSRASERLSPAAGALAPTVDSRPLLACPGSDDERGDHILEAESARPSRRRRTTRPSDPRRATGRTRRRVASCRAAPRSARAGERPRLQR
jgi:hypothetical protein